MCSSPSVRMPDLPEPVQYQPARQASRAAQQRDPVVQDFMRRRRGLQSTIHTSGLGAAGMPTVTGKTLLGQ